MCIIDRVTAAVKETYSLNLKRLCALALTAFIALQLKLPFLIAPPLIVAFVELSSNHPKLRHNSIKLAFVTFICAFSGAYGRILISEIGDLPLTISAIIIVMTMLSIMKITKLYFPPAGALAILPLLDVYKRQFLHHQDRRLIISQLVELLFIQEVP